MLFSDELPVLDPVIFRKCLGWHDRGGNAHKALGHEEYFLKPPLEALMPPQVPVRKRCDACALALRRHQKRWRVRKYRSSKFHMNKINWWNNVLQLNTEGKINLSKEVVAKLHAEIQRNGG